MDESWITPLTKWAERTGGNFFIEIAGFSSGNTLDVSIELWENDSLVNRRGGLINSDTTIELLVASLLLEQNERDAMYHPQYEVNYSRKEHSLCVNIEAP